MPRNKEYDRNKALEDAMVLFWTQGYTATSVQQLLAAMGISRSSMYSDFGNKRDLFLEAMALYSLLTKEAISKISMTTNPANAVKDLCENGFVQSPNTFLHQGCLLVNTVLELRNVDNELSVLAASYLDEIEQVLVECFRKCAANGTLRQDLDPASLASFFMTTAKGVRVIARQNVSEAYLRGVIDTALLVFQK